MPTSDPFNNTPTYPGSDAPASTATDVKERVSHITGQAKEKAAEFGRQASETIDRNIDSAASRLQSTADTLRSKAADRSGQISRAAGAAADRLDATAQYFRDHNSRDMVSGMEQMVRRNPGASLAAALAVGFLLGAALKRDRY